MNIILKNGSGEIEEKKSRFICHIFKIKSEEEAEEYITAVKKKYWDARHNCYAYVTGDKGRYRDLVMMENRSGQQESRCLIYLIHMAYRLPLSCNKIFWRRASWNRWTYKSISGCC